MTSAWQRADDGLGSAVCRVGSAVCRVGSADCRLAGAARLGAAVLAMAVLAMAVLTAGCATPATSHGRPGTSRPVPTVSAASTPTATPTPTPTPMTPLPVAPLAGRLPQTHAKPVARGPVFHAMVTDLWLAVTTGRPGLARQAFFSLSAYRQLKAAYDPTDDWRLRLWVEFALDVKAAHALLGRDARTARLERVVVDRASATWEIPGACYNKLGYWHVANSRVVYLAGGHVRSFGIASLISWRGVWYVIHLGGENRGAVGMVDAPAAGPGRPGPQNGC